MALHPPGFPEECLRVLVVILSCQGTVRKAATMYTYVFADVHGMLRKLEERGLVDHLEEGRKFLYRATVSMHEVTRSMASDLVDRLFDGSLADAVSHLLDSRDISREELDRLEQMIQERKGTP